MDVKSNYYRLIWTDITATIGTGKLFSSRIITLVNFSLFLIYASELVYRNSFWNKLQFLSTIFLSTTVYKASNLSPTDDCWLYFLVFSHVLSAAVTHVCDGVAKNFYSFTGQSWNPDSLPPPPPPEEDNLPLPPPPEELPFSPPVASPTTLTLVQSEKPKGFRSVARPTSKVCFKFDRNRVRNDYFGWYNFLFDFFFLCDENHFLLYFTHFFFFFSLFECFLLSS